MVLNEVHFKDLLFEIIPPPPVSVAQSKAELVIMGFPSSVTDSMPSLCAWYESPKISIYVIGKVIQFFFITRILSTQPFKTYN